MVEEALVFDDLGLESLCVLCKFDTAILANLQLKVAHKTGLECLSRLNEVFAWHNMTQLGRFTASFCYAFLLVSSGLVSAELNLGFSLW